MSQSSALNHEQPSDQPSQDQVAEQVINQVTDEALINWIESRRSIGKLTIPAPNTNQVHAAIHCAMSAPDHKKLKPWRFIVTQGNARHRLARALLTAAEQKAQHDGTTLSDKARQKILKQPLRAPMIITVVTQMQAHPKVPAFEQMLSAGAAAQNLILALMAQGYASVWRTGLLCNEPDVKTYFEVDQDDYVVGFVYTGSSTCPMPSRKDVDITPFVRFEAS